MNTKILAGALALSLVLAGCGGGGGESAGDDSAVGDELLLPADRTTAAPAATTPGTAAPTSPANSSRAATGAATTLQPTRRSPVTAPSGPAPQGGPTENDLGRGEQGSFAPGILRPKPGGKIRLELLMHSGIRPAREALDHVSKILTDVSGKPVEVTVPKVIPGGEQRWSAPEIIHLADRFGKANDGGPEAALHLLYLRGPFDENPNAAGVAVRGDVMAIFVDVISRETIPGVSRETIETAVLTHETGHLLGLVDLYLATGRQDPASPGHSPNKGSVMFWQVERADKLTAFGQGGPPRNFDAADLADLANIKNGAKPGSKG